VATDYGPIRSKLSEPTRVGVASKFQCGGTIQPGGKFVTYTGARNDLESAKVDTDDPAVQQIADALIRLSRAIESDFNKIEREISTIKQKLNNLR
jgi:hypothetical protein